MVCLDMKNIIKLRETLGYANCGWSSYTRIPVSIINEMEEPLPDYEKYDFVGDAIEYTYLRIYQTIMLDRLIKRSDYWYKRELHAEACEIFANAIQELFAKDDAIMF